MIPEECGAPSPSFSPKKEHMRILFVLLALLTVPVGCTVGPDYKPPETAVPQSWEGVKDREQDQTSLTTQEPAELAQWWKHFNDPVLTGLVERAIASNLDLAQAKSRIRQARASRGVVAAGMWPQLDASASYQRSRGSSSGAAAASPERDLFQAGLDAAWELDIFGGVRRNIEASNADIQAAIEDRRDVLISLAAEIGTSYFSLRGFQEQLAIARKNLQSQQHNAEITRKRYEAGYVSALDLANAKAQVATTESRIPLLESSARGTIYSLGVLLGQEPGSLVEELSEESPAPTIPPQVPVGIPSDLLRRRPDIRRSEAQIHAATARIGVATADLFPRFSLTGSFGFSSSDLASFADWGSRSWSLGPSVSWPIFSAGRIRSNIELQNALQEQAFLAYKQTVLTALQDVETALTAYAKEQQHKKSLEDAVVNNRKAVELAMTLYVAGKTDYLNVLSAQNALFATEEALAVSTSNLSTHLVAIYKALGGGWEEKL